MVREACIEHASDTEQQGHCSLYLCTPTCTMQKKLHIRKKNEWISTRKMLLAVMTCHPQHFFWRTSAYHQRQPWSRCMRLTARNPTPCTVTTVAGAVPLQPPTDQHRAGSTQPLKPTKSIGVLKLPTYQYEHRARSRSSQLFSTPVEQHNCTDRAAGSSDSGCLGKNFLQKLVCLITERKNWGKKSN